MVKKILRPIVKPELNAKISKVYIIVWYLHNRECSQDFDSGGTPSPFPTLHYSLLALSVLHDFAYDTHFPLFESMNSFEPPDERAWNFLLQFTPLTDDS